MTATCRVVYIGICFFLLFASVSTCQNLKTQIYKQLNYNELGFYLLCILYFVQTATSFISPAIVSLIGTKWSTIIGAISYSIYTAADIVPVACNNLSLQSSLCTKKFIYTETIIANIITGIGSSILWVAQPIAIHEEGNISVSFHQGLFWMIYMANNLLGNTLSAFMNYGKKQQFILYVMLFCLSILAIVLLSLIRSKPASLHMCSFKRTFRIIISPKIILLLPLLFYKGALLSFFSGSFPRLAIQTMENVDRFTQNRRTSILFLFQGVFSACSAMAFGGLCAHWPPRRKEKLIVWEGVITFALIMIVYVYHKYGIWFIGLAILLGINDGLLNTYVVGLLSDEFKNPEYQFGVMVLVKGSSQFLLYFVSSFAIEKLPYALIFGHLMLAVLVVCCMKMYIYRS